MHEIFQWKTCYVFATILLCVSGQKSSNFICTDGSEINISKICNGVADCSDKSDETQLLCYHVICPKGMFRCHYGACVKKNSLCNGIADCVDESDESQCGHKSGSCEKTEFKCQSGACIDIKSICDGKNDCLDGSDESSNICEDYFCPENSFHCKHGGCIHMDARCNGLNDCFDGSDESKVLCDTLKCSGSKCVQTKQSITCPPIESTRIRTTCESKHGKNKGLVPCNKPIPTGTIASYECKPNYSPINEQHSKNNHSICQLDGTWSRNILKCTPDCGKSSLDVVPMVVKGWNTKAEYHPWHTTLYVLEEGKWKFWCGGSIISEKAVLTAAHCTWKISPENMKAAFGKYYNDYDKPEPDAVIRQVEKIVIQPLYQDQSGNYGSDLAILILDRAVEFSPLIMPICIDWDKKYGQVHLGGNSTGLISGMGITEDEKFSDILKAIRLPVVSNEKCIQEQKKDFKKYITFTTFCAGFQNGSGVCNGDSGGGLVFPLPEDRSKWMIQGIVSISPRRRGTSFCDPNFYTVFTKVGVYVDWIKSVLSTIHIDEIDESDFTMAIHK